MRRLTSSRGEFRASSRRLLRFVESESTSARRKTRWRRLHSMAGRGPFLGFVSQPAFGMKRERSQAAEGEGQGSLDMFHRMSHFSCLAVNPNQPRFFKGIYDLRHRRVHFIAGREVWQCRPTPVAYLRRGNATIHRHSVEVRKAEVLFLFWECLCKTCAGFPIPGRPPRQVMQTERQIPRRASSCRPLPFLQ